MLRLRGKIPRETKWDIVVDLYFYREPEEAEKEEQAAKEFKDLAVVKAEPIVAHEPAEADWNAGDAHHWNEEAPAAAVAPVATPYNANEDWSADVPPGWPTAAPEAAAPAAAPQPNWGAEEWQ